MVGQTKEGKFPLFDKNREVSHFTDLMGRRCVVQRGLPYNAKTLLIDLGIALDENNPFLAKVISYRIVDGPDDTVKLEPEPPENKSDDFDEISPPLAPVIEGKIIIDKKSKRSYKSKEIVVNRQKRRKNLLPRRKRKVRSDKGTKRTMELTVDGGGEDMR
jgi:hypothetical protein